MAEGPESPQEVEVRPQGEPVWVDGVPLVPQDEALEHDAVGAEFWADLLSRLAE